MKKKEVKNVPKKQKNVKYVKEKVQTFTTESVDKLEVGENGELIVTVPPKKVPGLVKGLGKKSKGIPASELGKDSATREKLIKILMKNMDVRVKGEEERVRKEVIKNPRVVKERKPAKTKEEKDKIKKRIIAIGLLVPLLLPVGLCKSCARENPEQEQATIGETQPPPIEEPTLITETEAFDIHLYDVPNPYVEAWKMVRGKRTGGNNSKLKRGIYF